MLTATADLWTYPHADALCITTNGSVVRVSGGRHAVYRGVMGRGVAAQAKQRYPELELALGYQVRQHGNTVGILRQPDDACSAYLVSFPVKHEWHEQADLELIGRSAEQLAQLTTLMQWQWVVVPRPGCGNGRLDWMEVAPVLRQHFDDRFVVVTV